MSIFYWNNKNVRQGREDEMDAAEWLVYRYKGTEHVRMAFDAKFAWEEMPNRLRKEYNYSFRAFQREARVTFCLTVVLTVVFTLIMGYLVLKIFSTNF